MNGKYLNYYSYIKNYDFENLTLKFFIIIKIYKFLFYL